MFGGVPAEKETVGRVVGRVWRGENAKVANVISRAFLKAFKNQNLGSGSREIQKPDPDPDPEKFKNRIRIRIRIRNPGDRSPLLSGDVKITRTP